MVRRIAGWISVAIPVAFVFCFFFVPMVWLFVTSLSENVLGEGMRFTGTFQQYARYWTDAFYLTKSFWPTIWLSVVATLVTMVIGYMLAAFIANLPANRRGFFMMLVIVTLSVSTVIRLFGLNVLIGNKGVLNSALAALGLPGFRVMHSEFGVLIGLIQIAIPYAVVPLIGVLAAINPALKEAAASVGAGRFRTFVNVTLPLSMPGVIAGGVIVLSNNLSAMVVPAMMGGGRVRMIGILAYNQATSVGNMPFAAAIGISLSVVTILVSAVILWMLGRSMKAARK
ncbi:ABC transporter permease [Pseudogemmobacter sonorensis]|uniref:ABC transporter permease n=1 Tax=Pseudogemmobacter sonorensis TaxID=2989681 RepID=UPI0036B777F3